MPVGTMIGLSAFGIGMNVVGQIKAGNAAKRAGQAANDIEQYNASVAETQAVDAEQRGAVEEARYRTQVRGLVGTQRAGFASQGVDVGQGSALDVTADTAYLGELDALTIKNNAAREAYGYRVEAQRARMRGQYALETGQQSQDASRWSAVGTIAGGAATLLQQKYQFGRRPGDRSAA